LKLAEDGPGFAPSGAGAGQRGAAEILENTG